MFRIIRIELRVFNEIHNCPPNTFMNFVSSSNNFTTSINSCSSGGEDETDDPSVKAVREKERRQANNVRERYVVVDNLKHT